MEGNKAAIQNPADGRNFNNASYEFLFVLDTCEHLKTASLVQNCKTEAESQAILESMYVTTRIQTEFFNPKNFLRNGWNMNSHFTSNEI